MLPFSLNVAGTCGKYSEFDSFEDDEELLVGDEVFDEVEFIDNEDADDGGVERQFELIFE